MSRLADIYKSEKSKGGGIVSALGKRALEKMDPRKFYDQSGLLPAMFPSLFKAYKVKTTPSNTGANLKTQLAPIQSTSPQLETKIDSLISVTKDVNINSKMSAKNSMVLPMMARDMNIMRQNIGKLVKLQGGSATTKADMFFKRAGERENAYESAFKKEKGKEPTPTPTVTPEKQKSGGIFGMLGGILGFLGKLLAPLLTIGATIAAAVTGALSGLGSTILKGLGEILTIGNLAKALGVAQDAFLGIIRLAALVAANPVFLAIAGIATVAGILSYLRGSYDEDQKKYMELAKKKKENGALNESEQKELEKLNRPSFQAEARKQLGGYDPITGKVEKGTTVQSVVTTNRMTDAQLRNKATEELMNEGNTNPTLKDIEDRFQKLKKAATPVAAPSTNEQGMKNYKSRAGVGRDEQPTSPTSPSAVPSNKLLDVIAAGEGGSMGYDAANKGKAGDMPGGYPGLSKMTVNEVMRLQSEGKVFATGRYQIIPKTLAGLMSGAYGDTGVKGSDLYDATTQDKLATALINNRLKQGGNDPIKQQYALSQEFASIANPYTGSSYYDNVGNNKASIGTETIQAALSGGAVPTPTTTLASVSPAKPSIAPGMPNLGQVLASATSDFSDTMRMMEGLIQNVTNVTNNNSQASPQAQSTPGNLPSVYDDVFLNLFQRVT